MIQGMFRNRLTKALSNDRGFTLIELMIVIIIIGVMLGVVVIATYAATKGTDVRSASEMLKQDLRKVYAMAASGEKPNPTTDTDFRYRYRVVFNGNTDSPKNCYVIQKGTPDAGGVYTYNENVTPRNAETNKRSGDYIIPGNEADTQIDYGSNKTIYFMSIGSITLANVADTPIPGANMRITIRNGAKSQNINISGYGSISD